MAQAPCLEQALGDPTGAACWRRALRPGRLVLGSLAHPSQCQRCRQDCRGGWREAPEAGAQGACGGRKPCSVQPRLQVKGQRAPWAEPLTWALPAPQAPHRAQGRDHTQRMDGGLALSSVGQTSLSHSLTQSLEHVHLDSAAQRFRLPLPSTFQKYRSHTIPARAAEKTLGSAANAPAGPEIPPSPVASAPDPISLRCLGAPHSLPEVLQWGGGECHPE